MKITILRAVLSTLKNFIGNKEILLADFEDNTDGCRHVEELAIPTARVLDIIAWASEDKKLITPFLHRF